MRGSTKTSHEAKDTIHIIKAASWFWFYQRKISRLVKLQTILDYINTSQLNRKNICIRLTLN